MVNEYDQSGDLVANDITHTGRSLDVCAALAP